MNNQLDTMHWYDMRTCATCGTIRHTHNSFFFLSIHFQSSLRGCAVIKEARRGRKFQLTLLSAAEKWAWPVGLHSHSGPAINLRSQQPRDRARCCFPVASLMLALIFKLRKHGCSAQQRELCGTQSWHCKADPRWLTHSTMWPNSLEHPASYTHHEVVQESKNQCHKRHRDKAQSSKISFRSVGIVIVKNVFFKR